MSQTTDHYEYQIIIIQMGRILPTMKRLHDETIVAMSSYPYREGDRGAATDTVYCEG